MRQAAEDVLAEERPAPTSAAQQADALAAQRYDWRQRWRRPGTAPGTLLLISVAENSPRRFRERLEAHVGLVVAEASVVDADRIQNLDHAGRGQRREHEGDRKSPAAS